MNLDFRLINPLTVELTPFWRWKGKAIEFTLGFESIILNDVTKLCRTIEYDEINDDYRDLEFNVDEEINEKYLYGLYTERFNKK